MKLNPIGSAAEPFEFKELGGGELFQDGFGDSSMDDPYEAMDARDKWVSIVQTKNRLFKGVALNETAMLRQKLYNKKKCRSPEEFNGFLIKQCGLKVEATEETGDAGE